VTFPQEREFEFTLIMRDKCGGFEALRARVFAPTDGVRKSG
jgi:hypothetical protein